MKHLLIIDLESTCFERGKEPNQFFSEIIEIGAVVLNTSTLTVIDEFQTFIKPTVFPNLSDFCKKLTTITQEEADNGISISQAIRDIELFSKKHDVIFSSWGYYDKKQFQQVCNYFHLTYPFPTKHISIKHDHGSFYKKRPMGMEKALMLHNIPLDGTHHRGLDDAKNIAKIASRMIQDGWKF